MTGSRVDLVAGGQPPEVVIEFKFPREPAEKNAAWTMALGEVLKDLYRLAACPDEPDWLFVYAETRRLRQYIARAARRYGLDVHAEHIVLRPADAAGLPTTAARIVGKELAARHVTARRINLVTVDDGLRLAGYLVDPFDTRPDWLAATLVTQPAPLAPAEPAPRSEAVFPGRASVPPSPDIRDAHLSARREILEAVKAVLIRSGSETFTPVEIIAELTRRGTGR
ncbi:MAG TPA: hypothetical protein VFX16_17730 [Pseudonocardiaceae bacterium]|nr:hypothetical protein [Pseudonocardiaceae bacterium]